MRVICALIVMLCGCYSFNHFPHDNETREKTRKLYYVFSTNTLYFDDFLEFSYSISVTFNGYAKLNEYSSDTCKKITCLRLYYKFQDNFLSANKDSIIQIRFTKDWLDNYSIKITPSDWGRNDTIYGLHWQR